MFLACHWCTCSFCQYPSRSLAVFLRNFQCTLWQLSARSARADFYFEDALLCCDAGGIFYWEIFRCHGCLPQPASLDVRRWFCFMLLPWWGWKPTTLCCCENMLYPMWSFFNSLLLPVSTYSLIALRVKGMERIRMKYPFILFANSEFQSQVELGNAAWLIWWFASRLFTLLLL